MFRTVLPTEGLTHFLGSVLVVQSTLNMNSTLKLHLVMTEITLWIALHLNLPFSANRMYCSLKMASKLSVSYDYFLLNGCSKEDLILFNLIAVKIYYMACEKLDPGTDSIVWDMTTQILHRCYLLCQNSVWPSSSYSHKLHFSTLYPI
jgi:hypothetical protein